MSSSFVPLAMIKVRNDSGFLLTTQLSSRFNSCPRLTNENARAYTVYSRWARILPGVPRVIPRVVWAEFFRPPEFPKSAKLFREMLTVPRSYKIMSSVKATQLRPGMVIQHEGQLFTVFSVDHRTPGNKRGSMQTRMKNLRTGTMIDYRFRAEEFVDRAILDEVEFEYLYNEGDEFHFMNTQTYEQMQMTREELGETVYYLIPNTTVKIEFFEERPIGVDLPDTMELKVLETEPTLQKATASAVMKPATLETGLVIQVPPFVNSGDRVKVDTTEARYVQRVE
jgi:elongation factor P